VPAGVVVSTIPSAGSSAPSGSTIQVYVSSGFVPPPVSPPTTPGGNPGGGNPGGNPGGGNPGGGNPGGNPGGGTGDR
jgi:hypothetical protein